MSDEQKTDPSPAGLAIEFTLRAMAENYAGGHRWDHLDGTAVRMAADEITRLRARLEALEGRPETATDPHPAAVEFFGSEKQARAFADTVGQLHAFAIADVAPLGGSVIDWFAARFDQYVDYFARRRVGEAERASGARVSRTDHRVDPDEARKAAGAVRQAPPPSPPPPGFSR